MQPTTSETLSGLLLRAAGSPEAAARAAVPQQERQR